ncbi:uncharacterized protein LOC21394306 isoform X2 [Morus notabilis]|uniref:uncharacterized protein LOC21394306 isoform X2 n=1 Tax=Morus notabilis TaxID=981085 RepID=UPI000CED098F|nr:uncharacterized protein LOC21394306 isoform X2 [Morus notabilis]
MNGLSQISSHIEAILRNSHYRARTCLYGAYYSYSWTRTISYKPRITALTQNSALTRFGGSRLYSRKAGKSSESAPPSRRKSKAEPAMEREKEKEKEAFYVVRKGDVVGVYRSLNDCQAQVGSSICDPPVSVFKGHRLPKETQEYLTSRGLKDAIYTIRVEDMKEGLFGPIVQCALPVKEVPTSSIGVTPSKDTSKKRSQLVAGLETAEGIGYISASTSDLPNVRDSSSLSSSCFLMFDGASKGNPGRAGAGAVLLADDGRMICKLCEGLGETTNNVAEYRALLLGLRYAHKKGFNRISVLGDSKLVCLQVQGSWKVRDEKISKLYKEVKALENNFLSFQINHVLRDRNKEADAQANLATTLADGEILEEY